ncbi:BlaR1 family beta-lactam sensor/signal transducer [Wukongibacter baidiensis]|uniref:BlaR1 family beta-lactam sensor/signal transducer n=1 Tax=Wukongibacter baidiensis TaxID=1723361 RepID=UPI003D7FA5B9
MKIEIFLTWLIRSSLLASVVALLILFIKYIFKKKLGARWHYLIWSLLLIRMSIPFAPEASFSFFNLYNYLSNIMINNDTYRNRGFQQQMSNNSQIGELVKMPGDYFLSVNETVVSSSIQIKFWIWIMGVIAISLGVVVYNSYFYNRLRDKEYISKGNIIKLVENCRETMGVNKKIKIASTNKLKSPVIFGIINPTLLFPKKILAELGDNELEYIILHELAHYKRKDIIVNWITTALQIIHWFNPIIWYSFYRIRQDREVACDAYVLSYLKPEEYRKYGFTIIKMLENTALSSSVPQIAGFSSNKSHIKNRISMIASFKEELKSIKIRKLAIFTLLSCIILTNGKGMSETSIGIDATTIPDQVLYENLEEYFKGYEGSFVLLDESDSKYYIYNELKSQKPMSPCSTFKIITSLIGLENGIIEDENTELKWNGTQYPIEPWNKDHTLASAMRYSANWYFERVNQAIGERELKEKLKLIDYGNNDISGGIREFWAQSSLKISPIEQVNILRKIYNNEMSFDSKNIDILKNVLRISKGKGSTLSGKTGTGAVNNKAVNGWFIGYIEKEEKVYFFAVNIEGDNNADGTNARRIALSILKDRGLY